MTGFGGQQTVMGPSSLPGLSPSCAILMLKRELYD